MKSDNIVFAVAGVMFGLIAGWIIGAQQANPRVPAAAAPAASSAAPASGGSGGRAAVLDESQVQALKNVADREASNPTPRTQLANLYFDAERYEDRKSTRLNSSHDQISYAVFCLKKKKKQNDYKK